MYNRALAALENFQSINMINPKNLTPLNGRLPTKKHIKKRRVSEQPPPSLTIPGMRNHQR